MTAPISPSVLKTAALADHERITDLRRHFHRHPELSGKEANTSRRVADELTRLGLVVQTGVAGHGVVAVLEGAAPGRTALLRADMDALPVTEQSGVEFASQNDGAMHACGHDAHMAMALGVAALLTSLRAQLAGRVKFVFQPSEEVPPGGARPMVEAGVLKAPDVDGAFALHCYPGLPAGQVAVRDGVLFSQADDFDLEIIGRGGHGALPHQGADAIAAAAAVIQALQAAFTRRIDPVTPAVISIGRIAGGTQRNVLSDRVRLEGTARAADPEVAALYPGLIRDVAAGAAAGYGATAELSYHPGYPPLVNSAAINAHVRKVARALAEAAPPLEIPAPLLAGEDFSYFANEVPAAMFILGVGNPALDAVHPLHHPLFRIDEDALPAGVATMASAIASFCAGDD
jgi:amidohydrolase